MRDVLIMTTRSVTAGALVASDPVSPLPPDARDELLIEMIALRKDAERLATRMLVHDSQPSAPAESSGYRDSLESFPGARARRTPDVGLGRQVHRQQHVELPHPDSPIATVAAPAFSLRSSALQMETSTRGAITALIGCGRAPALP